MRLSLCAGDMLDESFRAGGCAQEGFAQTRSAPACRSRQLFPGGQVGGPGGVIRVYGQNDRAAPRPGQVALIRIGCVIGGNHTRCQFLHYPGVPPSRPAGSGVMRASPRASCETMRGRAMDRRWAVACSGTPGGRNSAVLQPPAAARRNHPSRTGSRSHRESPAGSKTTSASRYAFETYSPLLFAVCRSGRKPM